MMKLTKVGEATVATFFDWAKANVLKEDTPWIRVTTINGTYRWMRPGSPKKKKRAAPKKRATRARGQSKGSP
jgi:hypothetical protein